MNKNILLFGEKSNIYNSSKLDSLLEVLPKNYNRSFIPFL